MIILSNLQTYWDIAHEEHRKSVAVLERHRKPKPDGSEGHVITIDPEQRSFKSAMIATAFSGMYFEALMFLTAQAKFGREEALRIDRKLYEERLELNGVSDPLLLAKAKEFREMRKELIHEKADYINRLSGKLRTAQEMADSAIKFIDAVKDAFYN